jgi:CBS domain-containing protein
MKVDQLMTRDVRTVSPDTSLKDVAGTLGDQGISGLPVVDAEGRVLGVVSEADILRKEQGLGGPRAGVLGWLLDRDERDPKLEARTAGEAMTSPALTIEPARPAAEAARLMVEKRINRLPVVSEGRLVGIVTRADLVRAFHRPDDEIEREIREDVLLNTLWIDPSRVTIGVSNGEVSVSGEVETRTQAELVEAYIGRVPGVVDVHSELTWSVDDLARRASGQLPRRL